LVNFYQFSTFGCNIGFGLVDYFALVGLQSIVMSMSVCLSVCLFTHATRKLRGHTSANFCACCLWPWLIWCRCDALCTSSFMDDIMSSYHGASGPEWRTTLCL